MDKIVSRFRGKLVNISRDAGSKFDDYSISSKERYKNLSQKEKTRLKSTKEKNIKNWFSIKKKR